MTLEETIEQVERMHKESRSGWLYALKRGETIYAERCKKSMDEFRQLAEWLKELAERRKQPEQKIYRSMSGEEFEAWLYNHGICHPDIHEPIACDIVPSLIDDAINELPPVPPSEAIPVSWIEAKIELVNSLPGVSMLKMKTDDWRDLVEQWKAEQRSPEVDHDAQIREFAEEMSKHGVT